MPAAVAWGSMAATAPLFFSLMPKWPVLGAGELHHGAHAGDDLGGVVLHELGVLVDERLALGAVGDHEFNARLGLDVGGKAGAAGADYTQGTQHFTRGGGDLQIFLLIQ